MCVYIYINIYTQRVRSRYSLSIVFNQILKQIDNSNVYHGAKNVSAYWFLLYLELWRISKYKEWVRTNINFKVHFMDMEGGERKAKISDLCNNFEPMCWMQITVITSYLPGWWLYSTTSVHIYSGKTLSKTVRSSSFFLQPIFWNDAHQPTSK